MTEPLTGTWILVRQALRIDRLRLVVWVLGIAFIPVVTYATYDSIYPTQADRLALTVTLKSNPSFALLLGPAGDLSSAGGYTAWRTIVITAVFVAVMAILTAVRHTRTDEEAGRTELLAAGCLGRLAPLAAGMATATIASVLSGIVIAIGLIAAGGNVTGAVAYAIATTAAGVVFAAVAVVAAQIASYGRTAISLAVGALALAYLVRAWGDASDYHWVTWASPLGWTEKMDAFTGNRWWTLLPSLGGAAALCAVAVALAARRDFGRGLIASHHGPADAGRALSGTFGLAWRLHRGRLIGWLAGLAVYGVLIGSVARSVSSVIQNSAIGKAFLGSGHDFIALYIAEIVSIMGIIGAVYGIQALLTARAEEIEGRAELLLSTPLTRVRWLASHLIFALAGSALIVVAGALSAAVTANLDGASVSISGTFAGALAQIPAAWTIVGATTLLFGTAPRYAILGWSIITATFIISFFGPLLKLPRIVLDLSAYEHVPRLPGGTVDGGPLVVLSVFAIALIVIGVACFRRRSIVT
jgi:ABC-2 type transport system permease protein